MKTMGTVLLFINSNQNKVMRNRQSIIKTLRIMKFTAIILLACCLQMSANVNSQGITLHVRNAPLDRVFNEIKKQAYYTFVYTETMLKVFNKVSMDVKNYTIREVLAICFSNQPFTYKIIDKTVIVQPKEVTMPNADNSTSLPPVPPLADIHGRVVNQQGEPLENVSVLIAGTQTGTTTNSDGRFTIAAGRDAVLEISRVGYQTRRVSVGRQTEIDIVLEAKVSDLNDVVIIGYGTAKKSDLTGSVASLSSKTLEKRPTTNIEQALSGRVAGVDVSINSGEPGGSPGITIRGATSVSNTNRPLYVVDGVIMGMEVLQGDISPINTIDPTNIESIQVLKDASATAIFGARGANGVILITTKRGNQGGRVTYSGYTSVGKVARKMDLTNAKEWMAIRDIAYQNAAKFDSVGFARGKYEDPKITRANYMVGNTKGNPELFDQNLNPLYNTDWQDAAFQTAIAQNHNLSFTGGNKQTQFGVYLNYRDENGVMKDSWLKRYSGRFVINSKINDWLSIGSTINYNKQSERFLNGWALRGVYEDIPIMPVKFPDGSWAKTEKYPGVEGPNQRQSAEEVYNYRNTQTTIANVFSDISFTKNLKFRTTVAADIVDQGVNSYSGRNVDQVSADQGGIASIASLHVENWQFENLLTYTAEVNEKHAINAILGQSIYSTSSFSSQSSTYGFLDDYFSFNNLGIGSNPRPSTSSKSKYSMASYFGRINYTYLDKYLLTATGRVDGASKFGKNNRFAFFPSAALGWIISKEDFLMNNPVISYLKLRSSFGVTGNSEIPNYQYEAGLGSYTAIFNGSRSTGIGIATLANPNLKWEINRQFDLGLELKLFDNRIALDADVYKRVSNNMLLNRQVPTSSGYSIVTENVGSMRNQGLELSLTTSNIMRPHFTWTTSFNISMNNNKVLKLFDGSDILLGTAPGSTPGSIVREGAPVNTFIGYIRLGTWSTKEAAEAARYSRRPGDIKFKDINNDGVINSLDWVPIGNGLPKGYGALVNTFTYRNFELDIDIQFVYGNDVVFEKTAVLEDRTGGYNNSLRTVLRDAWRPDHQNTAIAQNKPLAVGYDTKEDTHRVKDGSFVRGKNITLSYVFSKEALHGLKVQSLRVYASGQNLFLISKFPGYDPEVSNPDNGIQFSRGRSGYTDYPKASVIMIGVQVGL
jgi:TonB-linked SusC/RagA family outer membrane protein